MQAVGLNTIKDIVASSIAVKQAIINHEPLLQAIGEAADWFGRCFREQGKILFCGNGGSAADAQHIAAELSGRFYTDRPPLYAEALHVNTSYLTAVANDYSFDQVYARMVSAAGKPGDILVALSTSGNSPNILKAIEAAREKQMLVIGMTGESGGKMASACDLILKVPSSDTPRIQEAHIMIGHIICQLTEASLFPASH